MERLEKQEYHEHQIKKYKTRVSEHVQKLDLIERERKFQKDNESKNLKEKSKTYAQIVKETVKPVIDKQKQMETEMRIRKLKNPIYLPKKHQNKSVVNSIILQSQPRHETKSAQARDQKRRFEFENDISSENEEPQMRMKYRPPQLRKRRQKSRVGIESNTESSIERPNVLARKGTTIKERGPPKQNPIDYLAEKRKMRDYMEKQQEPGYRNPNTDWTRDLRNDGLNVAEKYTKIVDKATKLEEDAKRKEQLLRAKGPDIVDESGEKITDLYIDAIKAKLAILGEL